MLAIHIVVEIILCAGVAVFTAYMISLYRTYKRLQRLYRFSYKQKDIYHQRKIVEGIQRCKFHIISIAVVLAFLIWAIFDNLFYHILHII